MPYTKLGSFGYEQGKNSYVKLNVGELSLGKELLLQPGSQIRSINFSATDGFQLLYDGTATFNDVNMRGTFATGVAGGGDPYIVMGEVGSSQFIKFYTELSGESQPPMLRSTIYDGGSYDTIGLALYGGVRNATYPGWATLTLISSASDGTTWPTAAFSAFGDDPTTKATITLEGIARMTLAAQTTTYGSVDAVFDGAANQHIVWSTASTDRWYFPTGSGHIQAMGNYHVLAGDGTAALPSFSTYNDPDSGMYAYGTNTLGFSTGGTARFYIDSDGIHVGSGQFFAGAPGSNDYITIQEGSNDMQVVLDGGVVFEATTARQFGYFSTTSMSVGNASNTGVGAAFDGDVAYGHIARDAVGTNLILQKVGAPGFNSTMISFYYGSTLGGSVYMTSASATTYATTSDYRLKKNLRPIKYAVESLQRLRPVEFEWIGDGVRNTGYLAHEAQELVPWGVVGEKDGEEYQQMDASKLIPHLHAAILEIEERLYSLESALC